MRVGGVGMGWDPAHDGVLAPTNGRYSGLHIYPLGYACCLLCSSSLRAPPSIRNAQSHIHIPEAERTLFASPRIQAFTLSRQDKGHKANK